MVSGRHKAYESEDKQADPLSKETSAYNFRISKACIGPAKFDKKGCLNMEGLPRVSKSAIDDIVIDLESGSIEAIDVRYWKGEGIVAIDINYKDYVALKRTKKSGVREVTVYNPENKMIEVIDFCIHKEAVMQEKDK